MKPSSSDSAASAPARAGSQDFAATLSDAGKPARKTAGNKHQDSSVSGSSLPPPGNQPPPTPTPPPQAKADVPGAVVANAPDGVKSPDGVKGPAGGAQAPAPNAVAATSSPAIKTGDPTTSLTSESLGSATPLNPATPLVAATALGPAAAALPALVSPGPGAVVDPTTASASGAPIPPAAGIPIAATPGRSAAARVPSAPAANAVTAKSIDSAPDQETIGTGNSAQNDSTLSNAPAVSGTDVTAQSVVAAAAAQAANAPLADSSSFDDRVTADSSVQQGAAVSSDPAAGAAAAASLAAMAHVAAASTAAAATAATVVSIAQALAASTGAGAADKHSRNNSPDSTLSGASTDGSVGAAQLLTSNTSTDGVPMPTFKIAAGVDTAQFGQGVADRVSLMMDGNLTNAKLQVNPPALGPIEVRIALQGGHAQIWMSSHSALTRDALESSSSKLREMLGSQGFSQVSVDISHRSFQERSPQSQAYEAAPSIRADAPVSAQAPVSISRSASGLLDAYA